MEKKRNRRENEYRKRRILEIEGRDDNGSTDGLEKTEIEKKQRGRNRLYYFDLQTAAKMKIQWC